MNQRFYSLDVFRGATVAFMILVNNPGNWSHIYPPLEHAPWHGVTPTDLVFPFFLFAVGNALAFCFAQVGIRGRSSFLEKDHPPNHTDIPDRNYFELVSLYQVGR
jgi:predicted acyltransferase